MVQELYQKAMKFAGEKHETQLVPGTKANYLLHISNVAMEVLVAYYENGDFDLDLAIQIAILHDVLEDTHTTFEELTDIFGPEVAVGVRALTKNESLKTKEDKIQDSLKRITSLPDEVGIVKLADRITNLQAPPSAWSSEKIKYYLEEARAIHFHLTSKNAFLANRLQSKIAEYAKYSEMP